MTKRTEVSPGNPNPNRPVLASHFVRALARIHRRRAGQPLPSRRAVIRCAGRIRRAAYASMAVAASPRRAWSRAVLRSLRGRASARLLGGRRVAEPAGKKIRVVSPKPSENEGNQEDELRRLVPGGRMMEFCSLLEETGHYIQCLTAQVLLMQRIADSMSG
uniref:Uncharacterized protein At4g30180 n=1 Tax=Anthurium amnicola TaxID=1678845 RepID=A0A1D1YTV4_9ARAE